MMNSKYKYLLAAVVGTFLIIGGAWFLIKNSDNRIAVPPTENTGPVTLEVQIGKRISGLGVTIEPIEVIEDSRCPTDVVCIQAGTVRLRANLTSGLGTAEQIFKLNAPITTEAEEITLLEVSPATNSKIQISPADYRFTFKIAKRVAPSINGLPESSIVPNAPTNFAKIGVMTINNPGQKQDTPYLIYEEPGKPALKKELAFDVESTCAGPNGSLPCLAMNATLEASYGGKRVTVEGLEMENVVLVRLIRSFAESDTINAPKTGSLILSWPSAVRLIETCAILSAGQTHSLDITLKLKDGRSVRTVEPNIDELFTIVNRTEASCGRVPVATE